MDSREELLRRRASATAADQVPGMFFSGLVSGMERELGADAVAKIRGEAKLPKTLVPFFRYPAADFLGFVDLVAQALAAAKGQTYEEALVPVGMNLVGTFFEGPVGRTMLAMLGGDTHRMFAAAAGAYKATFTFGEREYVKRGERAADFICRGELFGPEITRGIVKNGLELSSPADVTALVGEQTSTTEFVLKVTWVPRAG